MRQSYLSEKPKYRVGTQTVVTIGLLISVGCLSQAGAQSAAPVNNNAASNTDGLPEIIVRAERRVEKAKDVPISVSAVSGQTLEDTGLSDPGQLRFLAPGLGANAQSQTPSNADFSIRGVGTTSFSNAIEYNVSTVLDDIVLTRPEMGVVQYFDVDQVEVLRGAQVTLFGKNASAGVVNIRTQRPVLNQYQFKASGQVGEIQTQAGSFTGRVDATINIPLTDDSAMRFSAFGTDQDSLVDNPKPNYIDDGEKEVGFKGKYLWQPNDKFHVYALGDYASENGQGQHQFVARSINAGVAAPAPLLAELAAQGIMPSPMNDQGTYIGFSNTAIYTTAYYSGGGQVEAAYNFDNGYTLTNIFGYRFANLKNIQSGDAGLPQYGANLSLWVRDNQTTEEARIASPVGGFIDWQGGVYLLDGTYIRNFLTYQNQSQLPPPGFPWRTGNEVNSTQEAKSAAAFAEAKFHPLEHLTLISGARTTYDFIQHDNTTIAGLAQTPAFAVGSLEQKRIVTNLGYKLGATYEFDPNLTSYVTFTRGYKGPGFNSTAAAGQATPVNPEIPYDWEGGVKLASANHKVELNLGLFNERVKNYQANAVVTDPSGLRITSLFNAGEADSRGVEAELTARPIKDLILNASIIYADDYFGSFVNSPCYPGQTAALGCVTVPGTSPPVKSANASGAPLANAPRWTATLRAQYFHDLTDSLVAYFGADAYFRTKANFSTNANPYTAVPSYGTLDFRIGVSSPNDTWRAGIYVNNITDTRFPSSIQSSPLQGIYLQTFSPNSFRSFGVQATYSY